MIDRWRWLGTAHDGTQARALAHAPQLPPFDADQFRIVQTALERVARGELQWIQLP